MREPSSEERMASERSGSRTRPKRRMRHGAQAREGPFGSMRDMKDALRSVMTEMNIATKSDLGELDLRIQKVEEEIGRLPDLVAAEVGRQLKERAGPSEAPRTRRVRRSRLLGPDVVDG